MSEENNQLYYYHGDHLGSAQIVTDPEGEIYEQLEYTPYGELWVEHLKTTIEATPFRFTGQERDSETGLYYYGARYLNPQTSMWLSADPAMGEYIPQAPINDEAKQHNKELPGMGGVFNYVNLHAYHYAGNNLVKLVDPDGREDYPGVINAINFDFGRDYMDFMLKRMDEGNYVEAGIMFLDALSEATYDFLGVYGVSKAIGAISILATTVAPATGQWLPGNINRYHTLLGQVRNVMSQICTTMQAHHWIPQSFVTQGTRWYHSGMANILAKMGIDLKTIAWNTSQIPHGGRHLNLYMQAVSDRLMIYISSIWQEGLHGHPR